MRYFTSDLHIGHKNILRLTDRAYYSLDYMKQHMTMSWLRTVNKDDDVYILGDLALTGAQETRDFIGRLPGRKILIRGNHDRRSDAWYYSAGFTAVKTHMIIKVGNSVAHLSHYPFRPRFFQRLKYLLFDRKQLRFLDRLLEYDKNIILLHGHTHSKRRVQGNAINVGWDAWDRLATEEDIKSLMPKEVTKP